MGLKGVSDREQIEFSLNEDRVSFYMSFYMSFMTFKSEILVILCF